jgi:hypothetical protein
MIIDQILRANHEVFLGWEIGFPPDLTGQAIDFQGDH